jgi:terminase small subunit-like protein
MPVLTNSQEEAFARHMAGGDCSQTEAARRAGYAHDVAHNVGSRLMKRADVQERVMELQSAAQVQAQASALPVTRESLIAQAMEIKNGAIADKDFTAANRSLELIARISGHLVERRETAAYTETLNLHALSSDRLNSLLREQIGSLPVAHRRKLLADAPPELRERLLDANGEL